MGLLSTANYIRERLPLFRSMKNIKGHKKTVSKETNVSELEVVHVIHELPGEGFISRGITPRNLRPTRERVDEALGVGVVEIIPTPSPGPGVRPMDGSRSPGGWS